MEMILRSFSFGQEIGRQSLPAGRLTGSLVGSGWERAQVKRQHEEKPASPSFQLVPHAGAPSSRKADGTEQEIRFGEPETQYKLCPIEFVSEGAGEWAAMDLYGSISPC